MLQGFRGSEVPEAAAEAGVLRSQDSETEAETKWTPKQKPRFGCPDAKLEVGLIVVRGRLRSREGSRSCSRKSRNRHQLLTKTH